MHYSSLYVIQVCVVFQRPLQEASLLTQLSDMGTVIVGEHLIAKDGISNLQQKNKEKKRHNKKLSKDPF